MKVGWEFGLALLPGRWRIDRQSFVSYVAAREEGEGEVEDEREESGRALEVAAATEWPGLPQE